METKKCARCQEEKPLDKFWKNKKTLDGRQCYCIDCGRAYNTAYGQGKRKDVKKRAVEYKGGECHDCGFSDTERIECFDFHHLDPSEKDFAIGRKMVQDWTLMQKELDKCVMLCANCHRSYHVGIREAANG